MNKKLLSNKKLIIGAFLAIIFLIIALVSLIYTPYDPAAMNASDKFAGISFKHIMGCDNFGRDIFSRVMAGTKITIFIAIGTNIIGLFFGIIIGALTGYYGGILDEILMRFNDAVLAFPSILLALVFLSAFGPGQINVMISLGIVFVPSYARIIRSEYLRIKGLDYVTSAKLMGARNLRIITRHILPNVFPVIFSTVVIGFNNAVLAEAGLSFLGIGVQPPNASLGTLLSDSQSFVFSHPSYTFLTGGFMVLLIVSFSLFSDGFKEYINA